MASDRGPAARPAAFRIFNDRTLRSLAASRPATNQELLAIPGIGLIDLCINNAI
ncbi:MAG: hypothetical protein EPN47_18025 [Acidobacteria bacterium]|nr:MAG: hypothetical protein EPN47_18025 [Acidobacteriota bacterium]